MKTFADRIIRFNKNLRFDLKLPKGIQVMNPFTEDGAMKISSLFYKRYYSDDHPRFLILGINPGRFGAGYTGVPFTDTKRLIADCGIEFPGPVTHEPSSVFVYEVIKAMGGAKAFYRNFFIQSICPLGFTIRNDKGRDVNYNYYDSKELQEAVMPFILDSINKILKIGIHRDIVFCFGSGKNLKFIEQLNREYQFFKEIIPLEHPRFIMQYKSKSKQAYIDKYVRSFHQAIDKKKSKKK